MNYLNKYKKYIKKIYNLSGGSEKYVGKPLSELKTEIESRGLKWRNLGFADVQDFIDLLVANDKEKSAAPVAAPVAAVPTRPTNPDKIRTYLNAAEMRSAFEHTSITDIYTGIFDELIETKVSPWLDKAKTNKSIMFLGESHVGTSVENKNETIAKELYLIQETIKQNPTKRIAVLSEVDTISINGLLLMDYVPHELRVTLYFIKKFLDSISPDIFKISTVTTDKRPETGGDRLYLTEVYSLLESHDIVIFIPGLAHLVELQRMIETDGRDINYICINVGSKDTTVTAIKAWIEKRSKTNMVDYFNYYYPYYDGKHLMKDTLPFINIPVKPRDGTFHELFKKFNSEQMKAMEEQRRKESESECGGGGGRC